MAHKNSIRKRLQRYRKKQDLQIGMLGNYQYEVEVPGRPNFVYVRLAGQVVSQVYNDRVNPLLDLEVYVGYDDEEPGLLQVLGVRSDLRRYGTDNSISAYVPEHHQTHEWMNYPVGGNDVVFSELRQLMPLRPTPMPTGVALAVNRGIILSSAKEVLYFTGSIIDLGSYIPSTGSRFAYVGIDSFTGLLTVTGGLVRDTLSLTFSDVPDFIVGTYPIGVVRLYENQTKVEETYSSTDLIDLRFPFLPGFLNLYDAPGSYAGHSGKAIFVNGSETGLEFLDVNAAGLDGNTGIFINPMTTLGDMIYSDFGYVAGRNVAVYELGARASGSSFDFISDLSHSLLPDYVLRSDVAIDHWRNFLWGSENGIGYAFNTAYIIIDLGAVYSIVGWSMRQSPSASEHSLAGRYLVETAPTYTGSWTTVVTHDAPDSTIFEYVEFATPQTSRYFRFRGVYPRSGLVGFGENWVIENISLYELALGQKATRLPVGSNGQILTSRNITGALVPDWESWVGDISGSVGAVRVWGILGHYILTDPGHPMGGDMIRFDTATNAWKLVSGSAGGVGGATNFLGLDDTPDSYTGSASKGVFVNDAQTGLEFRTLTGTAGGNFLSLDDTPDTYTGSAGRFVKIKSDESGLEFATLGIVPSNLVLARYKLDDIGQAITGSTITIVQYNQKDYDNFNAVSTGTAWKFTAPRDGYYLVEGKLTLNNKSFSTSEYLHLWVTKNGVIFPDNAVADLGFQYGNGTVERMTVDGNTVIHLNADDWISIIAYQTTASNAISKTGTAGFYGYVGITSVDVEQQHPGVKAYSNANQTIPNNTGTFPSFNSEYYDTGNMHDTGTNTGRLVAPISGYYSVGCTLYWAANVNGNREVYFYKNGITGTVIGGASRVAQNGGTTILHGTSEFYFDENDFIQIQVLQTSGGNLVLTPSSFWMRKVG